MPAGTEGTDKLGPRAGGSSGLASKAPPGDTRHRYPPTGPPKARVRLGLEFVLRVVQSRAARTVLVALLVAAGFAATLYLLAPKGSRFSIQTGPTRTQSDTLERPDLPPTPPPLTPPAPAPDLSPTALPEPSRIVVVLQPAGASSSLVAQVADQVRRLGYALRSGPPAGEALDRSVVKYRPGLRGIAERFATEVRPGALLVEEQMEDADIRLLLGKT